MGAAVVKDYAIVFPSTVKFQVDAGDDVVAIKGTLRRVNGMTITLMKTWNRGQLAAGVSFDTKAGVDRYEIIVSATVSKNTTITGTTDCSEPPPANDPRKPKLRTAEGLNERIWLFFPKPPEVAS